MVGKWINGKPLYEKIVTFSGAVNTTGITYSHGIANVDMIYIDNLILKNTGEGESADTNYWCYSAVGARVNRTILRVWNGLSGSVTGTHMAILRFTKITDK